MGLADIDLNFNFWKGKGPDENDWTKIIRDFHRALTEEFCQINTRLNKIETGMEMGCEPIKWLVCGYVLLIASVLWLYHKIYNQ